MWVSHGTACCRKAGKVQGEKCLEVTKYTSIYINAYLYAHSTMQMCMHAPALSAHLHCNPCRCTLSCTHTHTHTESRSHTFLHDGDQLAPGERFVPARHRLCQR